MGARVDLRGVDAGATLDRAFIWYEPLLDADGNVVRDADGNPVPDTSKPIDLLGLTARMHIRRTAESSDVLLALTTENGGIILGQQPGEIRLYATPEQTEGLRSGVYDLELVAPNGRVVRLMQGKVRVSAGEVTR